MYASVRIWIQQSTMTGSSDEDWLRPRGAVKTVRHRKFVGISMRPRRYLTILVAAVCAILAFVTACGGSQSAGGSKVSVTMGNDSTPDVAYLPLAMAMKKLGDAYSVQKDIQFSGTDLALQALSQNKIQFMSVPIPQAASALARRVPWRASTSVTCICT